MKSKSLDESFEIISTIANKISSSVSSEQLAVNVQHFLETFMKIEYNGLYFYDEKSKKLKLIYAKNFSEVEKKEAEKTAMDRHPGLVFKSKKHLLIKDTSKNKNSSSSKRSFKILSRLYIPLVIEGKCVGTFGLASTIKNNFSEHDIRILSLVGSMTAMRIIAIKKEEENKEHLQQNIKLIRNLNIVNTFADVIQKSNTIDDVVWSITKRTISELGYIDCVVYLLDEAGEYLIQRAAFGNKNPTSREILNPLKIKIGDGIVGNVALTKKGEIIPDTSKDKRYILDDIPRLSEITVPIIQNDNIIGVIDSEHSEKNFFPKEHLELLTTIALMAATKLIQIRYNNNLLKYHNELEILVKERTYELNEKSNKLRSNELKLENSLIKEKERTIALITSEKKLKKSLIKEKELGQLKASFVTVASHQFRTPLAVIQSNTELLAILNNMDKKQEPEKYAKVTNRITSAISKMTALMDDVLTLGKLTSGKVHYTPEDLDLIEFCKKLCEELNSVQMDGRNLNFATEGEAYMLQLDAKLLGHTLSNLISNAFKYSIGKTNPELSIHFKSKELVLSVKDYGLGIPKEQQLHLFEPFFRADNVTEIQGTGLGLSIAKEYVEVNKGKISAKSILGEGSCFEIIFKKDNL
jgi:signal transduction histidine kinase